MNGVQRFIVVSIAAAASASVNVRAAEKAITRAQLPAAVEKTVAAQSQGATIKGFSTEVEAGRRVYEMQLVVDGHGRDITMDQHGGILEIEDEVVLSSLPAAVQDGLKHAAGSGTITRVESLTKKGTLVAYEAVVRRGTRRAEIQVGPDGRALTHPE